MSKQETKLKRVSELRKTDHAKCVYLYYLLSTGRLKRYIIDGYVYYDENEYKNFHPKVGRPIKKNKGE